MITFRLTIKRIGPGDIGALKQMSLDFLAESNLQYPGMNEQEVDAHMLDVLGTMDNPDSLYLIAYDGKKPAGFFLGYTGNKPYSQPRRVSVAQELYVVPEKRAGLVGLRLMEEAAKLGISQGAQGFECIGGWEKQADGRYGGTALRWEKFGFKPHVTYGHMEPQDFMALVQRFTKGRNYVEQPA